MRNLQVHLLVLLASFAVIPFQLLFLLSLGSGWSYPNIIPDTFTFAPWKDFLANRTGILSACGTTLLLSICVSFPSTALGFVVGRQLHASRSMLWRYAIYLPFVLSPMIVGICLYDLAVRTGLVSTFLGVALAQFIFALSFAVIFFSEMWSERMTRYEQLVETLGGNRWNRFRHGVLPQAGGLIFVCWMQTALYSWLDYGLVSILGGGNVNSLTLQLFSYIREASVNQASQSALILLTPSLAAITIASILLARKKLEYRL